jgi:KaiC/GvpD/RAD55 family RecA-like ATPase
MRTSEKVDFSKFGNMFQENLAKLILMDRAYSDQIGEVLETEYFETKYLKKFTNLIYQYKEKYEVHPSLNLMASLINTEMDKEDDLVIKQVRDFLIRIHSDPVVQGEEYIKDTALDFCKKQKLKEAIVKSVRLLEKSSFDQISDLINEALKLGQSNDFGYHYIKDFEKRFEIKVRSPMTTGWKTFDDLMEGGLGAGELGVAMAGTGAGKSHILVHLGSQVLKADKTVVHYTLELSETVVARRYDSCITKVKLKDLNTFKDNILEEIKNIKGTLIVKEYPTKSITTTAIKNHLSKLKMRGIEPDIIIVDYADLISPKKSYGEKRHDLESIYEELRGIAQENKCPVWTVSQTNRTGYNAELVTMDSISEAFSKCFVADFIFTLSRTTEDKNNNSGRFFVAKNRFGPDGLIYPVEMDTSNVKISVEQNSIDPSVVGKNAAKEQKDMLRQKYKELQKELKGE